MATLENVNAKLIPSNYIKAGQMEYVIWNTSFGKVGIKSRQSCSHFSWNIFNSYSKDQDLRIRKNRNFETPHSSCVDLCSVLKLQKLGSGQFFVTVYFCTTLSSNTSTHTDTLRGNRKGARQWAVAVCDRTQDEDLAKKSAALVIPKQACRTLILISV